MTGHRRTRCLLTTKGTQPRHSLARGGHKAGRSSLGRGIRLDQAGRLTAYGLALDSPPPLTRLLPCPPVFSLRTAPRVRSSSEAILYCAEYCVADPSSACECREKSESRSGWGRRTDSDQVDSRSESRALPTRLAPFVP